MENTEVKNLIFPKNGFVLTFTDITESKLNEQKIKSSLKEKEILIKEIHHRVKNNLQIVSSMLKLQMRMISDTNTKDILKDSQNRIQTISLIHKNLYKSTDLLNINFSDYLNDLVKNLFSSYKSFCGEIDIELNIENLIISIDIAMPCGIILNEMITNSLKYAFPDNRKGKINISFKLFEDKYELIFKDDGIGIPTGIIKDSQDHIGLTLIKELSLQLFGEIIMNTNSSGTEFKIVFPPLNNRSEF
jgi:two-component sensor histidine kinase